MLENWIKIAVEEIFEKHGIKNLKYDSNLDGIIDNSNALQGLSPEVSGGAVFQIPSDLAHGDLFDVSESLNVVRFIPGTSGNYLMTRGSGQNSIWAEGGGGVTDHGALIGLGDDDHSQYYNATRHTKAIHDSLNINADKVDACDAGVATGNVFKLPTGLTHGDIFYVNSSGNVIRLGYGTSGYFLKTQGAGANPIWTVHNKALHDALALDHGTLSGKADDDHTQYYNSVRHTKAIHDSLNINADQVDACHAGVATGNVFKLPASLAHGDIFYVNTSGNVVRLGYGTSGYFLKTQGAGANPIWAAGGGGQEIVAATLIVAANDSKDKNRADYECDGTDDHIQIQQALDALTAVGGKVVLLEGNYSGTVDLDMESKQALVGQGPSTRLSGMDIEIEANASEILIADMYINGNIDFKTYEIKDSIFRHLSGLDFACQNMASTSEGNLFDGVRAKQFKIDGKHNRFSDCYAYIPSGSGICFNLLGTATKNWLSNCHAYNAYDEDYLIQGTENHLIGCTSKDNRYIPIWFTGAAHRNIISGGMIDGGNVSAEGWSKLIRIQGDDNKISGMYIIVRETKTTHAIIIEANADGNMITDIRFKNEGVGSPVEISNSGTNTRLRDNVGFNRTWLTDV